MENNNKIIDGSGLAQGIKNTLKAEISFWDKAPVLAVVLIGENEASKIYVRNKEKVAEEIGAECWVIRFSADVSEEILLGEIDKLNRNLDVNGIIIQQPLPEHIDIFKVVQAVDPRKDVDGFSPYNLGLLQMNLPEAMVAATPKGIIKMLKSVIPDLSGKNAVIIGRSNIVGKPLSSLLLNENCTVTITHSKTKNLPEITMHADILIAACGCPRLIKKDWVKVGAVVIDVGINRVDGRLCGDVAFDDLLEKVSFISPVPKGVGPMTIAMLFENLCKAYLWQKNQY